MKCEVCGKGLSFLGDAGFKCPVCGKKTCTACMALYGDSKEWADSSVKSIGRSPARTVTARSVEIGDQMSMTDERAL